jgi:hypothetical protein
MTESDDAKEYRRCALDCAEMAKTIENPAHRLALLEMARVWMRLAEKSEKKPPGLINRILGPNLEL